MNSTQPKKQTGCLAKICIVLLVVFLFMAGCTAIGAYVLYRKVASYTAAAPVEIPTYNATQEEYDALLARFEKFRQAAQSGQAVTMWLSDADINTLIARDPNWKEAKGKLYVAIENNKLSAQASIPLTEVPGFRDRYLNGKVILTVSAQNGVVFVRPESMHVNGKPVPAEFLKKLQERNLAEQINQDPKSAETRQRIKDLKIENGKIIVTTTGTK